MNLTDWLGDHGWALWLSLALLLAVAEVVSLDLVLIMLAVGALAAAGTAAIAPDLWVLQILVGAGVSAGHADLPAPERAGQGPRDAGLPLLDDKMVGSTGMAMSQIDRGSGEIKVDGQTWSARTYASDVIIDQGTEIEVYEIDGAIAVVYPKYGEIA